MLTAVIGAWLTKAQGLRALRRYQQAITEGRLPHEEVMDGLFILVAGAVLLTPGFLTDAIGFALLVPFLRDIVKGVAKAYLADKVRVVGATAETPRPRRRDPDVINVEAEVVEDSATSPHPDPSARGRD